MARESTLGFWLRAWVQPLISAVALLSMMWLTAQRWRTLHGVPATAVVHALPGLIGSGKSSTYEVVVRYVVPQENVRIAHIRTNGSSFRQLRIGSHVSVRYARHAARQPLLDSEWSFSGSMILVSVVSLVLLLTGIQANKAWRSRRPAGYLS